MLHAFRCRWHLAFFPLLALGASQSLAQQVVVSSGKPDALYDIGEKITWTVSVQGPHPEQVKTAHFLLERDGYTKLSEGDVDLATGHAVLQTSIDRPGTVLAIVTTDVRSGVAGDKGKPQRVLGGAAVDPGHVEPSAARPADFDAFWAGQIKRLEAIPEHAQLTPGQDLDPGVRYWKLVMDNINGTHIYAQLAEPAEGDPVRFDQKCPALVILQWAGVYGLPPERVIQPAKLGWLVINVMPHDAPFDRDDAYYERLADTSLKNYQMLGSEEKQTSYFLRMYLSAYRAAQYLMHRSDWDGHTLVIMGVSQGGQQTISLAGLLGDQVTALLALVPSSCDVTGREHGRAIGYPNWADQAGWTHDPSIVQTGRYFDPVNFASRITCPALVGMGLLDETSPPTGVLAAVNQMRGKAVPLILVRSDHQGAHGSQQPFNETSATWLDAIVHGKPVPPAQ